MSIVTGGLLDGNLSSSHLASKISRSLVAALSEANKEMHAKTSNHVFFKDLLENNLKTKVYYQYLLALQAISETLEREFDSNLKREKRLETIYFPDLSRVSALNEDLNSSSFKKFSMPISEFAKEYVAHLKYLGMLDPLSLAAHKYVLDLGNLFGGLSIQEHVKQQWPDAVNLYDFSKFTEVTKKTIKNFIPLYKEKFDSLNLTEGELKKLVEEDIWAFNQLEKLLTDICSN